MKGVRENDVAVVGMACRLPGAGDVEQFWTNLISERDSIGAIPSDRFDTDTIDISNKVGGFIDDIDLFDAGFFGLSPREANSMDPQQRLLLELVWHSLEDAGVRPELLAGRDVGVYVGACNFDYKELRHAAHMPVDGYTYTGICNSILANRISYLLDLRGPSYVINTACSSSLVAIDEAISALRSGKCSEAIVPSISLILTSTSTQSFSRLGMLSPTGACRTFSADADGYVRGEGAVSFYLKRAVDAIDAGNRIHCLIKGSAINHGGRARTMTSPDYRAQARVMKAAQQDADVASETVCFIECHGTGTPLGDPIEIHGLKRAYGRPSADSNQPDCYLGAVKTQIGHLESAAGAAGMLKAILCIKNKFIPPNLHFENQSEKIDLNKTRLRMAETGTSWPDIPNQPARAGICSYGYGGANAHVIIEAFPQIAHPERHAPKTTSLPLLLSARSPESLAALANLYANAIEADRSNLDIVASHAIRHRDQYDYRTAVSENTAEKTIDQLRSQSQQILAHPNYRRINSSSLHKTAFVFSGQGSQRERMGIDLCEHYPVFATAFDECSELVSPLIGQPLLDLAKTANASTLAETRYAQPLIFSFQYAASHLWASFGVKPSLMIGHSIGEYAAACLGNIFDLPTAVALVCERGRLMHESAPTGCMVACGATPTELISMGVEVANGIDIAAINSDKQTVLSTSEELFESTVSRLSAVGIEYNVLNVSRAFHSQMMTGVAEEFRAFCQQFKFSKPTCSIISSVTGKILQDEEAQSPRYWAKQITSPVDFLGACQCLAACTPDTVVELGTSQALSSLIKRNIASLDSGDVIAGLKSECNESFDFKKTLAGVFMSGAQLEIIDNSVQTYSGSLPLYPFNRQSYWLPHQTEKPHAPQGPALRMLANCIIDDAVHRVYHCNPVALFGNSILAHSLFDMAVMPASAYVAMAKNLAELLRLDESSSSVKLTEVIIDQPLLLSEETTIALFVTSSDSLCWSIRACTVSDELDGSTTQLAQIAMITDGEALAVHADNPDFQPPTTLGQSDESHTFYQSLNVAGLTYGNDYQSVLRVIADDICNDSLWYWVQLSLNESDQSCTDPGLLAIAIDGLMQGAVQIIKPTLNGFLPVPISFYDVTITTYEQFAPPCWGRVKVLENSERRLNLSAQVLSAEGEILAEMHNANLRWVNGQVIEDGLHCKTIESRQNENSKQQDTLVFRQEFVRLTTAAYVGETTRTLHDAISVEPNKRLRSLFVCGNTNAETAALAFSTYFGYQPKTIHITNNDEADSDLQCVFSDLDLNLPIVWMSASTVEALTNGSQAHRVLTCDQSKVLETAFECAKALVSVTQNTQLKIIQLSLDCHANSTVKNPAPGLDRAICAMLTAMSNELSGLTCRQLDLSSQASLIAPDQINFPYNSFFNSEVPPVLRLTQAGFECLSQQPMAVRNFTKRTPGSSPDRKPMHYLITGGHGGIGSVLTQMLLQDEKNKVTLMSRQSSGQPTTDLGDRVLHLKADVTEFEEVRLALNNARAHQGDIDAVIHAAGIVDDAPAVDMNRERFNRVISTKVAGTLNLVKVLDGLQPYKLFLCSSVSSFMCPAGQCAYAAANAWMDAFAEQARNNEALDVVSINWGPWADVGMAVGSHLTSAFHKIGLDRLTPIEAARIFKQLQNDEVPPRIIVARYLNSENKPVVSASATHARLELPEIGSVNIDDRTETFRRALGNIVSAVLKSDELIESTQLQKNASIPLNRLGVDSLAATEIRARVLKWSGIELSSELLLTGASLDNLVDVLQERMLVQELMGNHDISGLDGAEADELDEFVL